jgi:hypothetical protein
MIVDEQTLNASCNTNNCGIGEPGAEWLAAIDSPPLLVLCGGMKTGSPTTNWVVT